MAVSQSLPGHSALVEAWFQSRRSAAWKPLCCSQAGLVSEISAAHVALREAAE
jgi:hypothetical protein